MDTWNVIEPLYNRHFNGLVRGLEKKLSRAEAEDIVQGAFIELRGALERGNVQNPKGLLERIVERRRADHKRDSFHEVAAGLTPKPFVPPLHDSVDRGLVRNMLAAAIRRLPRRQREAFTLIDLRGCTQHEVAQLLDLDQSTVSHHLGLARRELASILSAPAAT